jgi:hypothetical protein
MIVMILATLAIGSCEEQTTDSSASMNPPTELVANAVSETEVQLSWKDNSESENGFRIKRLVATNGTFTTIGEVAANGTQYSDKSLTKGTPAIYVVVSFDGSGKESQFSNVATATTLYFPPTKPSLTLNPLSWGRVELRWSDSDRETQYRILKGTSRTMLQFVRTVVQNSIIYPDTTLEPVTNYFYAVVAEDQTAGLTTSSDTIATTTLTASIRFFGQLLDALKGGPIANAPIDVTVRNLTTTDSALYHFVTDVTGFYSTQVSLGKGVNHRFRIDLFSSQLYNYRREFEIGSRGEIGDKREDIIDFERSTLQENPINAFQNGLKDRFSYLESRHSANRYTPDITWIHGWRPEDYPHAISYSGRINDSSRGVADRALTILQAKTGKPMYRKVTGEPGVGIVVEFGPPRATSLEATAQDNNGMSVYCFKWRIKLPTDVSGFPLFDENTFIHELQYVEIGSVSPADGSLISSPFPTHSGFGPPYGDPGIGNEITQSEIDNLNILRGLPLTFRRRYLLFK